MLRLCFGSHALTLLGVVQRRGMLANSKEQSGEDIYATKPAIESRTAQQRDDASDGQADVIARTVAQRRNVHRLVRRFVADQPDRLISLRSAAYNHLPPR